MPDSVDILTRLTHSRRDFLVHGSGLAAGTLAWPGRPLLHAGTDATPLNFKSRSGGKARSCILVYLLGGPPHLDTFDLKPGAPAEVRGPFSPIATRTAGVQICEHLPLLARTSHKYALVRSVSHRNSNHTPMIYYTLTGRVTALPEQDNDVRPPQPDDFPHMGSVLSKVMPRNGMLPGYIAIPEVAVRSSTEGESKRARTPLRGGSAGFLGTRFDPLCVNGMPGGADGIPALSFPGEMTEERFRRREELLGLLDRKPSSLNERELRDQAVLLTGAANQSGGTPMFVVDDEPAGIRDRYGRHRFGRAMLLARRLAEKGVPMIAIHFNEMTVCDGWDTHSKNFDACKSELLPMLDQSLSALLEDLDDRGLLEQTIVACYGEFGRTPKINTNGGRDHWGDCSTTLLAGGGIRGGVILGESDKIGAYPLNQPIDPIDVHATMYHSLGIDPRTHLIDGQGRPWEICRGEVIQGLIG